MTAVNRGSLPLSPCGRGWLREATTGEGLSQHHNVLIETPHPAALASTGGDALSHKGRGRCDWHRDAVFEFGRGGWLLLPLSPCGRGWLREATTGEGLSQHHNVLIETPHPTALVSTGGDALSHKGRGRCDWHRGALLELGFIAHSAASATSVVPPPRSTTLNVVRMRCVVPSWKRITVSMGMSRLPP